LQPGRDFRQYLAQAGLVRGSHAVLRADVFMMRICDDFRVMRRVVVTKHALSSVQVCIGIADAHRITQFSADYFMSSILM